MKKTPSGTLFDYHVYPLLSLTAISEMPFPEFSTWQTSTLPLNFFLISLKSLFLFTSTVSLLYLLISFYPFVLTINRPFRTLHYTCILEHDDNANTNHIGEDESETRNLFRNLF